MSGNYGLHWKYQQLDSDGFDADDAASTVGAPSSPSGTMLPDLDFPDIPFVELDSDDLLGNDSDDPDYTEANKKRAPPKTNEQKTLAVLGFMKQHLGRFSLHLLLDTLFTSNNGSITNYTGMYFQSGGASHLMEIAIGNRWKQDDALANHIVDKAAEICSREASWLTDQASKGPNFADAEFLRVKATDVQVEMLQSFRIQDLLDRYDRTLPCLQHLLKAVIGKTEPVHPSSRNPDMGRAMVTSTLLNLRSRLTCYHAVMNSLMLWDNRASQKLVKVLNRYGFCSSYPFLNKSITYLTKDSNRLSINVANDPTKLLLLPYDNFNWMKHAWETSATHGSVTHDQVSALLVVFRLPPDSPPETARQLADIDSFAATAGTRHHLSAHQSLSEILPNRVDQEQFSHHSTIHIAQILVEAVKAWAEHRSIIPKLTDPHALPAEKTEEYFLPTYDQEQSSTRGNMLVIGHYYRDVLAMPKEIFEERFGFLLGDRLTTARARAAQDQRALDLSEDRIDHLSSFAMLSGIMHVCMNMISNIGKNYWGHSDKDGVSLLTLLQILPNRSDINLRKIDFYAWLRFLDVVLRALILGAAMSVLDLTSPDDLGQR
ncbi:hypothetical protein K438DRAFT_2000147 [Mycena galopus ATCC 62051]|nr:hypothetical protein K438DRAFT_2000147 [Mycena galopus ATCC 62051]